MSLFKKAERKRAKLKIAGTGPSGSGKTYSLLMLATGLVKGTNQRIALLDTENDSASLYADRFDFDTVNIEPPFTAKKYTDVIRAAEAEGYVLIIDSLSHAWAGEGGILDRKSAKDNQGGNSYTNWAQFTKEHEELKSAILYSDIHILASMRSKQDYVMEQNEKGKSAPKKVGLAPIQREGMEYEFTVVFDFAMDHSFHVSKDRTGLFDGRIEKMKPSHGEELIAWLNGAKVEEKPKAIPFTKPASKPQAPKPKFDIPENPGDYICKLGKTGGPIKGKKVSDLTVDDWLSKIAWFKEYSEKRGEPTSFETLELEEAVKQLMDMQADEMAQQELV